MSGEQLPGISKGQPMEDARQAVMNTGMHCIVKDIETKNQGAVIGEVEITRDRVILLIDKKNAVVSHEVQRATQKA